MNGQNRSSQKSSRHNVRHNSLRQRKDYINKMRGDLLVWLRLDEDRNNFRTVHTKLDRPARELSA